jgi:lipopolysaccharide export system permease protein
MASMPSVRAAQLAPMRLGPRLPILDSYILREMAAPFGFGVAAFFLFWFLNIFFLAAHELISAHASPLLLLRFLIFRVPQSVQYAFPFACLFATLLGFGRLVADNEITALRTSGVTMWRIARTPLIFGVVMFGITYWINDTLSPRAVELSTRTFYQIIYNTASLPIVPQFFRKDPSTQQVFYVGNVETDQKTMDAVMIFSPATNSAFRQVINAEKAVLDGRDLLLTNARIVRFKPNGALDSAITATEPVRIPLPMQESSDMFLSSGDMTDPYMMSSKTLKGQIDAMKATGQGGQAVQTLEINLASKSSLPFASFVAIAIALPVAVLFGKKGRSLGFGLTILVLFVYYLISSASAALGSSGVLNPYAAAWLPNAIAGIAGALLFWRTEH